MSLPQINVFRSKALSDSYEMAVFLQLYGVLVPGYEEQVCNSTLLCGCLQSMYESLKKTCIFGNHSIHICERI